MKKIAALDSLMPSLVGDDEKKDMPSIRSILRAIGNVKASSADDARRLTRILNKVRDKSTPDLILENDDLDFLRKRFEENEIGLTSWMLGQILDLFDNAEKVEPPKKD